VTRIQYGNGGVMFGLRDDHDADEYGECRLYSLLPARAEFWQRGCPLTGLPGASVWRPRAAGEVPLADRVGRARRVVAQVRRVVAELGAAGVARSERWVRWRVEDQTAERSCRDEVGEREGYALAAEGAV
jgi:hypothetical protein